MPVDFEIPSCCPACGREMIVSELRCRGCQASLQGEFVPGPLARLGKEQQQFMLVFVRNRGNLREVQHELGLSYPTVRARLDQLVSALGAGAERSGRMEAAQRRQEIVASLARGEISAEEAVARLKAIPRN